MAAHFGAEVEKVAICFLGNVSCKLFGYVSSR